MLGPSTRISETITLTVKHTGSVVTFYIFHNYFYLEVTL